MLPELIHYFAILLDQEGEDITELNVCYADLPYVRYSISCIAKKFDYINIINKRFRLRSTRVRRHTLPSCSYASPWIDLACAKIFFSCNVPQQWHLSQVYA